MTEVQGTDEPVRTHAHTSVAAPEAARRAELVDLVGEAANRLSPALVTQTRDALAAVADRLAIGVEHSVVALVGGTGSGKSSRFNAITGLDVADVGARRPTTSQPTACVWGSDATGMLDFLGVPQERRFRGESALSGPSPSEMAGLVLLDVPDHDSVASGHRLQVDRLVPLVDLLVWVLDPQKYADHRLHSDYLLVLADRQDSMIVVLNQVDRVTERGLEQVRLDVARLLVDEGLGSVEILTTSARDGDGIAGLRETVRRVSQSSSTARIAVRSQLDAIASALLAGLGPDHVDGVSIEAAANRLGETVGVGAIADSLAAAARGSGAPVTHVREPSRARAEALRQDWLDAETAGLPRAWVQAVDAVTPDAASLAERATSRLRDLGVPSVRQPGMIRRLQTGKLEKSGNDVRAGYLAATNELLQTVVREQLAPGRAELAKRESFRAALRDGLLMPTAG